MISCVRKVADAFSHRFAKPSLDKRQGQDRRLPTGLAALGFLANAPVVDGLVPLNRLVMVLLSGPPGEPARSLRGYRLRRIPWGVAFGGARSNVFLKDLALDPEMGAGGLRLDLGQPRLAQLAFQLAMSLELCRLDRFERVQRRIELPKLWAAFTPSVFKRLKGDGPELAAYCRRSGRDPRAALLSARRFDRGLVLLPLDWVSHHWRQFEVVLADVGRYRKRQVFRLNDPARDLCGYRGASQFDFYHTRFRPARL